MRTGNCPNRWSDRLITFDVIVVGAGPAGLAAGISLAATGRSVLVLERSNHAPDGPGETLHPGIEPIFDQLGVGDQMRAAATSRHSEILIDEPGGFRRIPYGPAWRGFQIPRCVLNSVLIDLFCASGGTLCLATWALGCSFVGNNKIVETTDGAFQARWLIDSSGASGWLDRRLGKQMIKCSETIWLQYGYEGSTSAEQSEPQLKLRDNFWLWRAPLGNGCSAWVRGTQARPALRSRGARIADGTWKVSSTPAVDGIFQVGDAACRLDPRSGHGVLRAIMSSMQAAFLLEAIDAGQIGQMSAERFYTD